MANSERPLSPHLQIYRPQLTSIMSIFHRMTGVALSVCLIGLVWWLAALAGDARTYATFMAVAGSVVGKLVLFLASAGLFYHLFNGLRHLLWDIGWGYELPKVYVTGWSVVALTALSTAALWIVVLMRGGAL